MNIKRTATMAVVGAALAAWLAGAATSNPPMPSPQAFEPPPPDPGGVALAAEISRLQHRLRPDATPRQPGRNLFAFRHAPLPVQAAASAAMPATAPAATPAPLAQTPLSLAGVAEDPGPDGPIRTAVISTAGQVFLVKVGEVVVSRYRVERISPDVVELRDLIDGSLRRLALK